MAKELPYFKFEPSEWLEGEIQICSDKTIVCFVNLCSGYWLKLGCISYAFALQKYCLRDENVLKELIKNNIIHIDGENIIINFLDKQLNEFQKTSEARRKSANKRWSDANALQNLSKSNAIREEEIKEEERREEEIKEKKFNFKNSLIEYGFEEKLVNEWMAVRKNKKSTNTETSFKKFISQIELAPEDKNEILKLVIEKDWRGFEYQWLVNLQNEFKKINQPKQKMYGRLTEETMIKNGDMTGIINPYAIKNE